MLAARCKSAWPRLISRRPLVFRWRATTTNASQKAPAIRSKPKQLCFEMLTPRLFVSPAPIGSKLYAVGGVGDGNVSLANVEALVPENIAGSEAFPSNWQDSTTSGGPGGCTGSGCNDDGGGKCSIGSLESHSRAGAWVLAAAAAAAIASRRRRTA